MLNNTFSLDDEQLFTELTLEEGAAINGGYDYIFDNRTDVTFPFTFNGQNKKVAPLSQLSLQSNINQAVIAYDSTIGPGYTLESKVVKPGTIGIDREDNKALVIADGEGLPTPFLVKL